MFTLQQLEEHQIIAGDGQYLGVIRKNSEAPDSIENPAGVYGSPTSPLLAFNSACINPPRIVSREGVFLIYLTKNVVFSPRLDPDILRPGEGS